MHKKVAYKSTQYVKLLYANIASHNYTSTKWALQLLSGKLVHKSMAIWQYWCIVLYFYCYFLYTSHFIGTILKQQQTLSIVLNIVSLSAVVKK